MTKPDSLIEHTMPKQLSSPPTAPALLGRDLLSISQLAAGEVSAVFATARAMKQDLSPYAGSLTGRTIIALFEKPSLRTRVTFEAGPTHMGAHVMYFDHSQQRIGQRESVKDYALNLERWVDCIAARVFEHRVLQELAEHADVPVINALCDLEHPCQALADMFTLQERYDDLSAVRLAYLGDGNNVCHSLMLLCAKLGMDFTAITPKGFEPQFSVVRDALADAKQTGATITLSHNPEAAAEHDAVYTDCWMGMGQDHQQALRDGVFDTFQVNEELMGHITKPGQDWPLFMHCLPAHRGQEVTDEVIDSPRSIVFDQAENRMWAQNALLWHTLGKGELTA
jgi:ornithine carbamoyltransferase